MGQTRKNEEIERTRVSENSVLTEEYVRNLKLLSILTSLFSIGVPSMATKALTGKLSGCSGSLDIS